MPTIVNHYNWGMGGTDGIDQKISYYLPILKSSHWANRIFIHMLMVSVANAFIIFFWLTKKRKGMDGADIRSGLADAKELIAQLAEEKLTKIATEVQASIPVAAAATPGRKAAAAPRRAARPLLQVARQPRQAAQHQHRRASEPWKRTIYTTQRSDACHPCGTRAKGREAEPRSCAECTMSAKHRGQMCAALSVTSFF